MGQCNDLKVVENHLLLPASGVQNIQNQIVDNILNELNK
jgi:hypothetical protein